MTPQVVVIGAGAAGLMAAISAREAGARGDAGRAHRRRRPQDPDQRRRTLQRAAVDRRARAIRQRLAAARWCAALLGAWPLREQRRFFERRSRHRRWRSRTAAASSSRRRTAPATCATAWSRRARARGVGAAIRQRRDRRWTRRGDDVAGAHGATASWPGDARDRRHRRAVGAADRQRRLRPGSGARARPRRAPDLRGAHAAHRRPAGARRPGRRVARPCGSTPRRPASAARGAAASSSRIAATAGRPCSTSRTWRCAASGPGPRARPCGWRGRRMDAAAWRIGAGRRSRAASSTAVGRHLPQRLADAAGARGRRARTTAPARSCGARSVPRLLRAAHGVRAAVDRRRGLPHRRGHRRRRGPRRGAPRHAREPARARAASSAARCSTRSGRLAATTSAGPGPPGARPACGAAGTRPDAIGGRYCPIDGDVRHIGQPAYVSTQRRAPIRAAGSAIVRGHPGRCQRDRHRHACLSSVTVEPRRRQRARLTFAFHSHYCWRLPGAGVSDATDDLSALRIERAPLHTGGRRWGRWVACCSSAGRSGRRRLLVDAPRRAARGRGGRGHQRARPAPRRRC